MSLTYASSAPSNIALIKYMGKSGVTGNWPTNASLSFTLKHLRTFVSLEVCAGCDQWAPLEGLPVIALSERGREKFLNHLERLRKEWGFSEKFLVRSANNFPSDCGLASSASSFAALTEAVYEYVHSAHKLNVDVSERSRLSRLGSGSSCRSFFAPWAKWRTEGAEGVEEIKFNPAHAVILVDEGVKAVSSSDAHQRVLTSLKFTGRSARAEARLEELTRCLVRPERAEDWRRAYEICREEYIDMHELFETSLPPFAYRTEQSRAVCEHFDKVWRDEGDGPLVTMDAGPNVHILLRPEQTENANQWLKPFRALKSWTES